MSGIQMTMTLLTPRGCMPPMMFRDGDDAGDLPPETCTNTTLPLLTISAGRTNGWLALNVVNSGAVSPLRATLDSHSMFAYAADGLYVEPQKTKVSSAPRSRSAVLSDDQAQSASWRLLPPVCDLPNSDPMTLQVLEGQAIVSYNTGRTSNNATMHVIDDLADVWMLVNGSAKAKIPEFDPMSLRIFVTWVVDGSPYVEPKVPIIYRNASDGWPANTTLHMPLNSTIDIIMKIANDSMDTMGHPMHLHGHRFWVLGTGTGAFPYDSVQEAPETLINLHYPPYRDTHRKSSASDIRYRYVTDNPGLPYWHIVSGMQVVLAEGEDQLRGLIGSINNARESILAPIGGYAGRESAAWRMRFSSRYIAAIAATIDLILAT
ncbi:hypothetical protein VTN00DRAFT_9043 [Thermoascus crustaceus]|uniref:uncharacterized protein n=1 Tax=Thermoascus crustaceus TaxID=5088 RepID=UPI003742B5C8